MSVKFRNKIFVIKKIMRIKREFIKRKIEHNIIHEYIIERYKKFMSENENKYNLYFYENVNYKTNKQIQSEDEEKELIDEFSIKIFDKAGVEILMPISNYFFLKDNNYVELIRKNRIFLENENYNIKKYNSEIIDINNQIENLKWNEFIEFNNEYYAIP